MLLRCAFLLLLLGCPGPDATVPCTPPGDPSKPIALRAIARKGAGVAVLADGDTVFLESAPQGGAVIYAGAEAKNVCGAVVTMTAELVDPATGKALTGADQRQGTMTVADGDYAHTDNPQVELPNIPSCPNALHVPIDGHAAILRVLVSTPDGRSANLDRNVVPRCPAGDAHCASLCR